MSKRSQNTKFVKDCLADSLIRLMEQGNSFSEITVAEICDRAGVGRTTYYRHFDNKDGKSTLIRTRVYSAWEDYFDLHKDEFEQSKMKVLIDFIYSQKDLFQLLHHNGLTKDITFDVLYLAIGPEEGKTKAYNYWKSFLAGSIYGFIYNWLQTGCVDSPEYLFELISKVYPD